MVTVWQSMRLAVCTLPLVPAFKSSLLMENISEPYLHHETQSAWHSPASINERSILSAAAHWAPTDRNSQHPAAFATTQKQSTKSPCWLKVTKDARSRSVTSVARERLRAVLTGPCQLSYCPMTDTIWYFRSITSPESPFICRSWIRSRQQRHPALCSPVKT